MRTVSAKQQEIREREQTILDLAQAMLLERGYLGLSMDRIAEEVGVSKGTVYQHFVSKEDLLAAVAVRSANTRAELFERAATFRGTTRERMGAIGAAAELFFTLFPHHEQAERVIKSSSGSEKITPERSLSLDTCVFRCFGTATGVIRDAVASGDLALRPGQSVEQVCVGLWNLYTGAFLMRDLESHLNIPAVTDPMPALVANSQVLLDGFGWRALSTEHDYESARLRVFEEVFPTEAKAAGLLPA
ncbi:TetR/AcrR family transcriptional regulator [Saltatorellus ferox]